MINESIRRNAYWTLDYLKGSPVRKHLKDIEYKMEQNEIYNNHQLNYILDYATKNVSYYMSYQNYKSLDEFPVINKNIIKENYKDFMSKKINDMKVVKMQTSGSTGTPFTILQDVDKRNRCLAEMMYFWGLAGYKIGMRYIYYRSWNKQNRKSKFSAFARNIKMRDILRFDDDSLKKTKMELINDKSIKMLLGYASTLEILGHYLYDSKCKPELFEVKCIIAISESLSEPAKEKLKHVFGCPVISHYSNSENGVLAQFDDNCNGFIINNASFHIELLDFHSDEPVPIGKPGRIVITDLYNKAMPMIRYDTGDIGIQKVDKNGRVLFESIEGRKIDFIFDTNGKMISPHEISVLFWQFPEIKQYQFIQKDKKEYLIKINKGNSSENVDIIVNHFKGILGKDANIYIEFVNDIPTLASGKRKYIINEYSP